MRRPFKRFKRKVKKNWRKVYKKTGRFSKKSIEWRKAVFKRDQYTCQRCHKTGGCINAHHIRPWKMFPKERHNLDNGVTLCRKCHKEVHAYKDKKFLILE